MKKKGRGKSVRPVRAGSSQSSGITDAQFAAMRKAGAWEGFPLPTLELERVVQCVIALAQVHRPWVSEYAHGLEVLLGAIEHETRVAGLSTRQVLQLALDRVTRAEELGA